MSIHVWKPPVSEAAWDHVEPHIVRACKNSAFPPSHYQMQGFKGRMTLWLCDEGESIDDPLAETLGCFVTRINQTPRGRFLEVELVGGVGFDRVYPVARPVVVAYAKANACDFIEFQSRPGLLRKLPEFDCVLVTMRMPVDG